MQAGSVPRFQNLKDVGAERQVVAIHYHQDTYSVITADGRSTDFWESNLRFKVDSSDTGPLPGKAVILPTGMMGDRASVFFASPAEISTLIRHQS
jgi:cytochrome c